MPPSAPSVTPGQTEGTGPGGVPGPVPTCVLGNYIEPSKNWGLFTVGRAIILRRTGGL